MKLVVLYRPNSEHASTVESFVRDLQRQHDNMDGKIDLVSVDTRAGSDMASLYDVWLFPTLIAMADNDGSVLNTWSGEPLPLMDEVVGYLNS